MYFQFTLYEHTHKNGKGTFNLLQGRTILSKHHLIHMVIYLHLLESYKMEMESCPCMIQYELNFFQIWAF